MRLKAIVCQVFTREIEAVAARSPHSLETEILTMGLHDLGSSMRVHIQEHIDAADAGGYDAIVLGYALCGRGTEGLRARRTQLVLPRAHDCIGILMGDRWKYLAYFEGHRGVYYRSPGWTEFQKPGVPLQPASASATAAALGERSSLEDLVAHYGEENGRYLFEQFRAYRHHYSGLTYISTGVESDGACRERARIEAATEGWVFEEVPGAMTLLERLVGGDWDERDFLVVPPGAAVCATLDDAVVGAG